MESSSSLRTTAISAGAVAIVLFCVFALGSPVEPVDSNVYHEGAQALINGTPLYHFAPGHLLFTYPPFAALILSWMAPMTEHGAWLVMTALSCATVTLSCQRALRLGLLPTAPIGKARRVAFHLPCWTIALVILNPFWETIAKGQINIILMAVCLLGLTTDRRFWGGFAIGLCGGCKLTPLALGLPALRRHDWAHLAGMATGFLASIAIGWLLLPGTSQEYWTDLMWDTGRVGGLDYPANASVNGVLWRHCPTTVRSALWILLGLAVIVAGWLLLPRHLDEARRSDDLVTTVAVSASVMLLISPVSWNHHWVWLPFIAVWAARVLPRRPSIVVTCLAAPVALAGPLYLARIIALPLGYDPLSPAVAWTGDILPVLALVVLVGALVTRRSSAQSSYL